MPELILPGAERHQLDNAPMAGDGGSRAVWHITWDRNATAAAPADLLPFDTLAGYFSGGGAGVAPHILWDPFTGRIAQFFSATSRAKALMNPPGGVETNRKGDVTIQIEILFFPYCRVGGRVYATVADTPCKGLDRLMAWLRSWGVPDVWPMGAPTWSARRSAAVWNAQSGHYGHSQVPENDHTDPGPMPDLFGTRAATPEEDDDMPTAKEIADAVWQSQVPIPRLNPDGSIRYEPGTQAAYWPLVWGNIWSAQSAARDAALQSAVTSLAGLLAGQHSDLTAEQITEAVRRGIEDGLVHVQVDVNAPNHTA